jgi:hypothetical protein
VDSDAFSFYDDGTVDPWAAVTAFSFYDDAVIVPVS